MKIYCIHICLFLVLGGLSSCTGSKKNRKSAEYYQQNKTAILEMRNLYDSLYRQQPFSVGFTDQSFTYYAMEITTDTVRYIFNTEKSEQNLHHTILRFRYDTSLLRRLAIRMKEVKCLWLDKATFYLDEKKDTITFLSFKSVSIEYPFVENKYYVLLFFHHPVDTPLMRAKVKKGDIVKVDEL
ncbi:MAG TPA: hypothetical protein VJ765_04070, partial [Chitinophagaceae bacterium]|nr:hypothetical protein [Chitinophagaceae bacterium]